MRKDQANWDDAEKKTNQEDYIREMKKKLRLYETNWEQQRQSGMRREEIRNIKMSRMRNHDLNMMVLN